MKVENIRFTVGWFGQKYVEFIDIVQPILLYENK